MSISDTIVVMKEGVIQQIGKPQEVYDDPVNLFVATFLGTPPIHVFDAAVRAGRLYIGETAVLDVPGLADGEVTAAVRPEGFDPDEGGSLCCALSRVEVMGRDVSVVCSHPACENGVIRAIVSAEEQIDTAKAEIRFSLKPSKVFVFDKATGARLRPDGEV